MKALTQRNLNVFWLTLIFALAAMIYACLFKSEPLTWDDGLNIFTNPNFQNGAWAQSWKEPYAGLYAPVADMFWEILYNLSGARAWPFRVFNLFLHLANSWMVFLLLRGLSRRWKLQEAMVLMGTALFTLHPLQVHAVAWISGGRDLMAAFFALASLCVYFGGRSERADTTSSRFALATALFLTSMLCKPSTLVLPLLILGLEALIEGRVTKLTGVYLTLWFFFAGAVAWLAKLAQPAFPFVSLSFVDRFIVALDTYSFYLQKFVAPYPLSANYARTPAAALADSTVIASVLMTLAILSGFAFLSWRRDRRYLLVLIWFAAMLPVSGLIPFSNQEVSTVSDHYNYFPMAVLAALATFVLSRIEWGKWPKAAVHAVLGGLIFGLSLMSWNRAQAWTSDQSFFIDMSKHSPDSYPTALGMSMVMCEDLQQYDEGIKWTEVALKAKPLDVLALANQAFCFLQARNYFRVIELEYYLGQLDIEKIERTQPTAYSSMLSSIGSAYIEQQEYEDGFQFLCEAFRVNPGDLNHETNLKIAKDLLESKGIEPTCEQVQPGDEGEGDVMSDPIQEIWPQFE